ncbi:DUF3180 domain-containing protein [Brevibacterium luteolum]|uniref:DUF3180 domain-containing protein n=1 Tax=Brevibacterium luteolum TaxID=199591 RepID=UPI00223B7E96|nr:DUF3180 domain-containing protein [Brevibacterium luteolum]MCT1872188.1 DUF3180 domain-containing protein [Brevibacterium luteolum]MCT1889603.1 DUF3180 domain-containing protein [Brevibacterium luteolum]MCT1892161.1 DUF3180 domain-containing protein [Brevibacterium luteolum]MCT1922926.1 DUF3180 domain-containing protein [Brevibacterium luteolum]
MTQTKPAQLLTWGILGIIVALGFNYIWESLGQALPGLPWPAIIGMLALSVVLLILGWPIKKWNDGDRTTELDHVRAARVAMMAKAAALAGSLLTGWYLGGTMYLVVSASGVRAEQAGGMLLAVAAAAIVMVVGLVVESFCQLPPDDTAGADAA